MRFKILVINPGSTSTRLGYFEGDKQIEHENIFHPAKEIGRFKSIYDQKLFRKKLILDFLERKSIRPESLDAVVGRGGLLKPIPGGTYLVNPALKKDLETGIQGEHASNLGGLLASEIADRAGIPAYIVDPVVVDELDDVARITGIPEISRRSIFHALNQKICARMAAAQLGKPYRDIDLIVAHLGGGISVGAHRKGRVVDVNNALDGDGPIAPERAGSIPAWDLAKLAFSGDITRDELKKKLTGLGGMVAYLGVTDMRKVIDRIENGDERARLVFKAMAFTIAKQIGACAAVLAGSVDAVVLTGGLAYNEGFIDEIKRYISFLGPVIVIPGEDELAALAQGALRVLRGEENALGYV